MSQDDVETPATDPVEPATVDPETVEADSGEPESGDEPEAAEAPAPETETPAAAAEPVECPPPADQPERQGDPDPRARLNQLATQLVRNRSRRLLIEFLQLRRALRA